MWDPQNGFTLEPSWEYMAGLTTCKVTTADGVEHQKYFNLIMQEGLNEGS